MSLQYIIDGYNAIYKITSLKDRHLQDAREGLVRLIIDNSLCGSPKNKVLVVFDGKDQIFYAPDSNIPKGFDIKIIFTHDETADDKIKRLVDESSNPKQIVVVTDDRDILYYCRAAGARIISVKEWSLSDKMLKARYRKSSCKLHTCVKSADTITNELKKIWL